MSGLLQWLGDAWVRRSAQPDPAALQAVAGLKPAVVITGASRGIGLELAKQFTATGAAVVLVARHPGPLAEAMAAVRSEGAGREALPLALDVTEPRAFDQITATLDAQGLYLDVLINNAGLGLGGDFAGQGPADIDRLVALNVAALTRLTRLALPGMLARGRGGVLNVASLGGLVPGPYQAAYYASKAYVVSLTLAVAAEYAGRGVRIAALAPGPVETTFHASMGAQNAPYRVLLPGQRPETVARAARRGFVLGQRLIVPGLINPVFAWILRALPFTVSVPLMGWLLKPQ
jgi:short-subunit dehydrogenase